MYKTRILIISGRKELSVKYKKLLENLKQEALFTGNLSEALGIIQKEEIEFIIISDTIKEKLSDFIRKIRVLTYNFRPVIIAVSKSSDIKDRLEILESGADDVLGEEIPKSELQMRFLAHIRRYSESYSNPITQFSTRYISQKAIKQSLYDNSEYGYLLIKIRGAVEYRKIHGEIAYEKAIKTLGAIINSTLSKNDFIGHMSDSEFILITNPYAIEQVASFLTFAFDNILNKFYSPDEFENNFTIQSNDSKKENKTGLMRLNAAACLKANHKNYQDILNNLYEMIKMLEESEESVYIIDRAKLSGETTKKENKRVLIYEPDQALSYLLKSVCEMKGILAKLVYDEEEFMKVYEEFMPCVVLLDWGYDNGAEKASLKLAKRVSQDGVKLIFSSSYLNKKEILKAGADLYMPKPYEIDDMINSIKKFL